MKQTRSLIFIILAFTACHKTADRNAEKESAGPATPILVDELLKNPGPYVERTVTVEGLVTHVCMHSGKRLHLKASGSNEFVRVEAKGDIGQFDRELEGDNLVINGIFRSQVIDKDYLARWETELTGGGQNKNESHTHSASESDMELLSEIKYALENSGKDQITQLWIDGESFSVKPIN
ncbi:MAG TPA: hypothetical protein VI583_16390 [Cyclobacteriaceae bacterium]|nr:hypothetical protein [Cyclobacteriaceae bacterium]